MKNFGTINRLLAISLIFAAASVLALHAQTAQTIYSFAGASDGSFPGHVSLVQGPDGQLYGTTAGNGLTLGTVFKITTSGTLTTLHTFSGSDGGTPEFGLALGTDGNFYGTASIGGTGNSGTVFKITSSGAFTLLHSLSGSEGIQPGLLVLGTDGNFYGTAQGGPASNGCPHGCGSIFKITPSGTFTTIHNLAFGEGVNPGPLMRASNGVLYGTALTGGRDNSGSIFSISSGGTLTLLHSFTIGDGAEPQAPLMLASDGNFYEPAGEGGAYSFGSVIKMAPSGVSTLLYSFCSNIAQNCPDGAQPVGGMTQASDGTIYGTTSLGGAYSFLPGGTIFTITPTGSLTTLFSFNPLNGIDGTEPGGTMLQASDGNFYGTTTSGGAQDAGTVYRFLPSGRTLSVTVFGTGTVTSTDGFINCPGTCTHIYANNSQVTLDASAGQGWGFAGWSGACSGSGSCQVSMTQDRQVTATFSPTYTLTVTTNGSGSVTSTDGFINCPGACSHSYLVNTQVQLNANPAQGWGFSAWSGAGCSGSNPTCFVTMTGNQNVSATFTQSSYTLTVSPSGQGSIFSSDGFINCPGSCSHTYLSFTQVTLNAAPAHGWNFAGWSGACSGVGSCQLTMLGNYGVSAYFTQPGSGLQFSSVTPCRLIDTRQTGTPIQGGSSQNFIIPQLGGCNIPSSASAYSLNVTVVPHGSLGYLTVWPAGLAQPGISTMNSRDGRTKAAAVIVQAGNNDAISIYASNTTDVILDVNGYFGAPGAETYQFYPLTPCRVIDTRQPTGDLGGPALLGAQKRDFPVQTSSCMPQGVTIQAYAFNVTVVPYPNGQPLHYLTVWPEGEAQPTVSTLNNGTATTLANAAIVPAGTSGGISVYASDSSELVVDINGYFAAPATGGLSLYPTAPCRVIDTRQNGGQPFQGEKTVDVVDSVCAPPSEAQAYVLNATVVPPGPMHYLTLWADPGSQPSASILNAIDGSVASNLAIIPNTDGSTDAYASDPTQLILDISSYFAP